MEIVSTPDDVAARLRELYDEKQATELFGIWARLAFFGEASTGLCCCYEKYLRYLRELRRAACIWPGQNWAEETEVDGIRQAGDLLRKAYDRRGGEMLLRAWIVLKRFGQDEMKATCASATWYKRINSLRRVGLVRNVGRGKWEACDPPVVSGLPTAM